MKFNLDNYKGKYVMHCKTEEEACDFCNFLHQNNKKWSSGDSYLIFTNWSQFTDKTCYYFNVGIFGSIQNATNENYMVLEWEDFMKDTISTNNATDENTNKKYVKFIDNYNGTAKIYKLSQNILDFLKQAEFDFNKDFLNCDIEYNVLEESNLIIKEF